MWEFLDKYWIKFINGYCKVDFLCVNNDPNWLGWIPIGFLSFIFIGLMIGIVFVFFGWIIGSVFEILESIVHTFKKIKQE